MQLVLSRINSASDFEDLANKQFESFTNDDVHNATLGTGSPESVAHLVRGHTNDFQSDPADVWVKVTDEDAGGRLVAASNWKLYPVFTKELKKKREEEVNALNSDAFSHLKSEAAAQDAADLWGQFLARRYKYTAEPCIVLNILFIHPSYQRKGIGRLMLDWGMSLADQLMLPCWVEPSKEGHRLYASRGFESVQSEELRSRHVKEPEFHPIWRRPARTNIRLLDGKN